MKRIAISAALILCCLPAFGQQMITTRSSRYNSSSTFSIGPRISNYSTDIENGPGTIKTGRQSSFGLVGDFRTGSLILDFVYDHDPQNGFSITDIIVDTGNYQRDRGEGTIGFAVAPVLDLQGGFRVDSTRVGGASVFGNPFLTDLSIDHQALTAGVRIHSDDRQPVAFYVLGRGYIGSAKFDIRGLHVNTDTSGYRGEAGLNIRIGDSAWSVVPGIEYEHIETKDYKIQLNTNRAFLNVVFRTGR
jgi:hypothetical protein